MAEMAHKYSHLKDLEGKFSETANTKDCKKMSASSIILIEINSKFKIIKYHNYF